MSLFCFRILPWQEGERIDKCIVLLMDSLSRSYIQKMIRDGHVQVNGKAVRQNYRVDADDLDVDRIVKLTKSDKKMDGGHIRFVLLDGIGHAVLDETVTDEEITAAVEELNFKEEG